MRLTRLTERSDFLAAGGKGRRFRAAAFTAQVLEREATDGNAAPGALRIGLTASRHVGNAPVRNRIRRRLRAAATLALAGEAHKPVDIVLVARREVLYVPFTQLSSDIARSISGARAVKASVQNRPNRSSGQAAPAQPPQKR